MRTFRDVVLLEVDKAGSIRELARRADINHEILNKIANGKDDTPTIPVIAKMAKYTGTDFMSLVALAYPDLAEQAAIEAESRLLLENIERLPEDARNAVWAMIRGNVQ
jgi:transcriptional regulator with XRE-family HTH domain